MLWKCFAAALVCSLGACGRVPGPDRAAAARASARRHTAQSMQVLDLVGRRIEDFFASRQERVEAFSDDVFSLGGKWRAIFWGRDDFERHIRRRFEARVFRPEDFEREVVAPVREDLAFAIDASEAGVAADLSAWARASRPGVAATDLKPELSRLVAGLVLKDLGLNIASIAGSEVAVMAASAILTRAGILGASAAAGAASSWATLGIGLVVGTVVGIIIDSVVGDELEDVARDAVRFELDALRRRMLEGEDGLWQAAKRALEAHGKALERSAARLVEDGDHVASRT